MERSEEIRRIVERFTKATVAGDHEAALGRLSTHGSWTLTDPIKFLGPINSVLDHDGKTNVSFTFAAKDSKGNWQIDDEYVDPIKSQ